MRFHNLIIQEDLDKIYNSSIDWHQLRNSNILITGATGMLASYFSFMLMYLNERYNYNIKIFLLARNAEKLVRLFGAETQNLRFLVQDVCDRIDLDYDMDYIFHSASSASPYSIVNDPVGIIKANTLGTINVLDFATRAKTTKVIFTSTREIYGKVENKDELDENEMGIINPLDPRSCYPESKRIAETLLKIYSKKGSVNFNSLRISHVYGPGMQIKNDGRVMSDLIYAAINNRDIYLKSPGLAERSFCYISDALEAIFLVLILGINNEAYNISNELEPINIINLAKNIQSIMGNNKRVFPADNNTSVEGYCNYPRVKLNTTKIENLGWKPTVNLKDGLLRTIKSFHEDDK